MAVKLTFEMLKKAEKSSFTDCLLMENLVNKKISLLINNNNESYSSIQSNNIGLSIFFDPVHRNPIVNNTELELFHTNLEFNKYQSSNLSTDSIEMIDIPQVTNYTPFECLPNKMFQ